jgi:hypothetical protein
MDPGSLGVGWAWTRSPPRNTSSGYSSPQKIPAIGTPRRLDLSTSSPSGSWTPGCSTRCDPLFHPGRRLCYSLGDASSAEAEKSNELLAELFLRRHDKFHLRLEACIPDRPAVSLRGEPRVTDLMSWEEKTQYEIYAERVECMVQRLNASYVRNPGIHSFYNFITMQGWTPLSAEPHAWPERWKRMAARKNILKRSGNALKRSGRWVRAIRSGRGATRLQLLTA